MRPLRDDARAAADTSRSILETSKWWGLLLKQQTKPRTYIVVSYGGCGSKMLAGWLAQLPRKYKHVYHFHDKRPPDVLRSCHRPLDHLREKGILGQGGSRAAAGFARRRNPSPILMITAFCISSRTPSRPWCRDLGMGTASIWTAIVGWNKVSRSWMSMPNRVSTAWVYWPSSRRIPHHKSTPLWH